MLISDRLNTIYHKTDLGNVYHADSLDVMKAMQPDSVDLVMTSPPFGLTREKEYGKSANRHISIGSSPLPKRFTVS